MRESLALVSLAMAFAACSPTERQFGSGGGGGASSSSTTSSSGGGSGAPVCGNGVKEPGEACDDGADKNNGAYGGCTKDCALAPHCGDGSINGPDEACDDGDMNGLGPGQCNPACTGHVLEKSLKIFTQFTSNGNLTNDWDPFCQTQFGATYKAVIVDGMTRIASMSPNKGDGQVDWVLKPYMRYINAAKELVWTTDEVSLLGVRDGQSMPLLASLGGGGSDFAWAGFEADWTTSTFNCGHWAISSGNGGSTVALGLMGKVNVSIADCSLKNYVLCAEQ